MVSEITRLFRRPIMAATVKEREQKVKPDMQEMMKVYMELGTPGAPHMLLARMAGSWKASIKTWTEPGKPATEHPGTSVQKMLFDGRFLQAEETMDIMGPYKGMGITGYDNFTKKYTSFWFDSMNTRIMYFEGAAGADGKSINMESSFNDPVRGPMKNRSLTKILDSNRYTFEMFYTDKSGKEEKMMEITYTRQK